jgi:hypothetical protein
MTPEARAMLARHMAARATGVHVTVQMGIQTDDVATWAKVIQAETTTALHYADHATMDLDLLRVHVFVLAHALRNLRRAVKRARRDAKRAKDHAQEIPLHKALMAFDARIPDAVKMRNVVEHLDDYIEGRGWDKTVGRIDVSMERSTRGVVRLHLAEGLFLDVREAADAAQELADRATAIIRGE